MPFQPVQAEKLSLAVIRQIELLILRGILKPGERLPSERDLAETLGVSRPSLREALSQLESRELLTSKPGSGVFVAEVLGSAFAPPLIKLFSEYDEALFDYLSFRRELEGMAAARAAQTASDTDLQIIDAIFRKMEAAHQERNHEKEAELDAEFHLAIIEASHNVIMVHMMRSMFDMLRSGVFYNRQMIFKQQNTRQTLLDQHKAINVAIQARLPDQSRQAVEDHLHFVESAQARQKQVDHNEEVAKLRLAHETMR